MAKSPAKAKRKPVVTAEMVAKAQGEAVALARALTDHLGQSSAFLLPAGGGVPGDTPPGITVTYDGPEEGDIPIGALQDNQVVALIKNVLIRGRAPFIYRFHNQIYLRVCGPI